MAEVIIVDDADAAGQVAAGLIALELDRHPALVLGVATGSTPNSTYRALAERRPDLSQLTAFALDEYVGLEPRHPQSYAEVLRREFGEPLGVPASRIRLPGQGVAPVDAGAAYERAIVEAGGIDLQILGIGTDGHVGFNEPGSSLASLTRVKTLTEQTRADNARFFDSLDDVPLHCFTQGLGTIRRARALVLLAFGAEKAEAIAGAVEGPVSSSLPGSVIQLHPNVTVIVDEAAAGRLANGDYYRYAWQNRPEWAIDASL